MGKKLWTADQYRQAKGDPEELIASSKMKRKKKHKKTSSGRNTYRGKR